MNNHIPVISFISTIIFCIIFQSPVAAQGEGDTPPDLLWQKNNTIGLLTNPTPFIETVTAPAAQLFPTILTTAANFSIPLIGQKMIVWALEKTSSHDLTVLNAGWYVDWSARVNPGHPGGIEYARTIYFNVHDTGSICYPPYSPGLPPPPPGPATTMSQITANYTGTALIENVRQNPGALWLIGNEFDASYNGSPIQAELYTELYHYFYTTIKATDPTAKVAIGAVSQPSPLRMAYLDKILNHYQSKYGQQFPTDLWNIHFYYMNEEDCEWGAGLPPFAANSDLAWVLSIKDFEDGVPMDLAKLETNLRNFRQWLKDRGYQNIPLIITEYGVLATPDFGGPYTNQNAASFLRDTVSMFKSTTDSNTGYNADSNRLVQMWSWFSTRHEDFGGNLFDENGNVSVVGQSFAAEAQAGYTPYVDLALIAEQFTQTDTSLAVEAYLQNNGNTAAHSAVTTLRLIDTLTNRVVSEKVIPHSQIDRRYQSDPLFIAHGWEITSTQTPLVPYELAVSVTNPTDVDLANNAYTTSFNWSSVANLTVSDITFSVGNPYQFNGPVTTTITATITNQGNFMASATTADIIANQTEILRQNIPVPVLAPGDSRQITATRYLPSREPLRILVKLNGIDSYDLDPESTRLERALLYKQIFLPLILR